MEKKITIQGVDITLRDVSCACNGKKHPRGEFVNIVVNMTNRCEYKCKFCCNTDKTCEAFDYKQFIAFINETVNRTEIKKITFTGGEPGMCANELCYSLPIVKAISDAQTVVCTNGWLIQADLSGFLEFIDKISLSRHHHDYRINSSLFGVHQGIPVKDNDIFHYSGKDKINLSCNLIKGAIDCEELIYDYLEWADSLGIKEVAFVGLMPVNEWCKKHFINPAELKFNNRVLHYCRWDFPIDGICRCDNYAYLCKNGNIIRFYIRHCLNQHHERGSIIIFKNNKIQTRY